MPPQRTTCNCWWCFCELCHDKLRRCSWRYHRLLRCKLCHCRLCCSCLRLSCANASGANASGYDNLRHFRWHHRRLCRCELRNCRSYRERLYHCRLCQYKLRSCKLCLYTWCHPNWRHRRLCCAIGSCIIANGAVASYATATVLLQLAHICIVISTLRKTAVVAPTLTSPAPTRCR